MRFPLFIASTSPISFPPFNFPVGNRSLECGRARRDSFRFTRCADLGCYGYNHLVVTNSKRSECSRPQSNANVRTRVRTRRGKAALPRPVSAERLRSWLKEATPGAPTSSAAALARGLPWPSITWQREALAGRELETGAPSSRCWCLSLPHFFPSPPLLFSSLPRRLGPDSAASIRFNGRFESARRASAWPRRYHRRF